MFHKKLSCLCIIDMFRYNEILHIQGIQKHYSSNIKFAAVLVETQ